MKNHLIADKFNRASVGLTAHSKSQSGFTMIEILVAFLLSIIGLQGLVAVQSLSLGTSQNSYYRAQAVILVNDIAGRMNANPQGVLEGSYNKFSTKNAPDNPNCYQSDFGCNSTDVANKDLNHWSIFFMNVNNNENHSALLPNGVGRIDLLSDGSYEIDVSWDESRWNTNQVDGGQQEMTRASISRNVNVLIPF